MFFDLLKKGSLLAAGVAALAVSTAASAWTPPNFPRVGGIQIGSPFNYNDPTYEANLAKQSIMILADYPTMAPGGMSMQQAVTNIKAKNPNALVFTYVNANQLRPDQALNTTSWGPYRSQMDKMKW